MLTNMELRAIPALGRRRADHPQHSPRLAAATKVEQDVRNQPPPSLSIHAQCFWEFTPTERRVMEHALDYYIKLGPENSKPIQVARILRYALDELSTQD